jgi:hypothetical protein
MRKMTEDEIMDRELDEQIKKLSEALIKANNTIDRHREQSIKIMETLQKVLMLVSQNPLIDKDPYLACLNNL